MTAPPPPKPLPAVQLGYRDVPSEVRTTGLITQTAPNELNPYSVAPLPAAIPPVPKPPAPIGNIAKAISTVMTKIGVVIKEGVLKGSNFSYKYATIGDVLHKLTPLLGENGLMIVQNEVEHKFDQRHVAVTYEFSIAHSSGEVWPDKPRKTGMAMAADKYGNWDDKAFNKAATAARKYFLLELFQVPTGDMDDADSDGTAANPISHTRTPPPPPPVFTAPPPPPPPGGEIGPHRIVLGKGSGAAAWVEAFIKAVGTAANSDDLQRWIEHNSPIMANLANSNPDLYQRVQAATTTKHESFEATPATRVPPDPAAGALDPSNDPDAAIDNIKITLSTFTDQAEMEAWWNTNVAPTEAKWFPPDFTLLLKEFERNEVRIAAQEAK